MLKGTLYLERFDSTHKLKRDKQKNAHECEDAMPDVRIKMHEYYVMMHDANQTKLGKHTTTRNPARVLGTTLSTDNKLLVKQRGDLVGALADNGKH